MDASNHTQIDRGSRGTGHIDRISHPPAAELLVPGGEVAAERSRSPATEREKRERSNLEGSWTWHVSPGPRQHTNLVLDWTD
jgi:hypothetical protein